MIKRKSDSIVQVPIDRIRVVNPRTRGRWKFKQISNNIAKIGLKKPITVAERPSPDGRPLYDLVCGQGRLEVFIGLGESTIPALVVEAHEHELLLMSLAENLARRRHTAIEMMREIATLRDRGHALRDIAEKTALSIEYVRGILRLLKSGEHSLIVAVEQGQIPINVAMMIATADEETLQRAMTEAYENNDLRGKQLLRARQLIERRRAKAIQGKGAGMEDMTCDKLIAEFNRESVKQRSIVQKAKRCETQLMFVVSAFKDLMKDASFVTVLRNGGLSKLPQFLAEKIGRPET